jgi:HEAT repeats/Putative zinc-finger
MTCDSVSNLISLYYYGELMPEEEDRLETHLAGCAACARELEKQRKLAAALDQRTATVSPLLLDDCRADLMAAVAGGAPRIAGQRKGPWALFLEAMASTFGGTGRWRQPLGATALVALGFMAAKITPANFALIRHGVSTASMVPDDVFSTVRSVQPDSSGRVQISFDETHRRAVEGRMDDPAIQRLLLAASHEENPAVRVESVDILKGALNNSAGGNQVRDALLNALANDPIARVRLKALEGLKAISTDPEVRKTLAQVLQSDDNAAVRMQVVDLLVAQRDDSMVGVLQHLMQHEDNGAVRLKCEKALKEMNASIGTF